MSGEVTSDDVTVVDILSIVLWWRQHWLVMAVIQWRHIRWRHKQSTFYQQFYGEVMPTFICNGGHFVECWHQGQ